MADDKKNPKEASNIFHSIMKASVSNPLPYDESECPYCGEMGKKLTQRRKGKDKMSFTYKCPNDHTFVVEVS